MNGDINQTGSKISLKETSSTDSFSLSLQSSLWYLTFQNFVPVDNFNTNNKNDSPNKLIIAKKSR